VSEMPSLVLLGFGGHARSVADVALSAGYRGLLFVDDNAADDEAFLEFSVQRLMPPQASDLVYMPCAGDNSRRRAQILELTAANLPLATIVSPSATIGYGATIAPGCFVGHHAHVGPLARLGTGCIVNTGAVVEHDCVVGECTHVSVHACLAGRSSLGDRVFLGAGSVVIDKLSVASDITIGAGGVVIASLHLPGVYVGVPVKRIADSKT
jgi:UDP-N-acetylbacillosamine N-acetyltransferase